MQFYFCKNVTDMEGENVLKLFTTLKYKLCIAVDKRTLGVCAFLLLISI